MFLFWWKKFVPVRDNIYILYLLELGHDENGYIDAEDEARLKKLKSLPREETILERREKFAKELEKA